MVTVHKTMSTSCRRSSKRKWRNCTSLHSTVLTQVWSRCPVQLLAHICELCLPTERGNIAADGGQSGHQAHIYAMCLSAKRGIDMDTGKKVLFALPLFKLFSPSTPPGVSVETTTGQHIDVIANFPVGFSTPRSNPPAAQKTVEVSLSQYFDRVIHMA